MSSRSSRGLADSVAAAVRASHARHIPVRIDEMNTIGCGVDRAVGESFASALWALDAAFNMARVGVDGINIASFPGATFELFKFSQAHGRWHALVEPEYYGLLMFAQAAPVGSRLLTVSPTPPAARQVRAWATRAPDRTIRVVVINEGAGARVVRIRARGATRTGTLELLTAPSLLAHEQRDPRGSELRHEHHDRPARRRGRRGPKQSRPPKASTRSRCRPRPPRC